MGMEGIELRQSRCLSPRDMILHKLEELDDDGKPKRTGTEWTASAHIITAVIGSGVLSLAWAMSQLGWIAGPVTLVLFSVITFFTSTLLADCYRTSDPNFGQRNYTYMDAVKSILGGKQVWLCGLCQYVNLCGVAIGYTITGSISAAAISKSNCYHAKGHKADCTVSDSFYMIGFGIVQIFLSQLPNFHELWWLSIVAAVMSFAYSSIAVVLSFAKVVSGNTGKTSLTGQEVGSDINSAQKIWETFQALGDIAFAYSYSMILIEIQDTLKSPPAENKVMKKATFIGVSTTTVFYILSGCLGYAAFGNHSPGNILTGFGFYEPYWLVDFANFCIIVHLLGAYQVFAQPVFAAVEKWVIKRNPNTKIVNKEFTVIHVKDFRLNVNMFRLIWRSIFVVVATILAILMPFFNDILAFLGAASFWPLTVHLPTKMYIAQKNIERFSPKWMLFKTLSFLCFFVSLAAACGSIEGVIEALHHYTPFQTKS